MDTVTDDDVNRLRIALGRIARTVDRRVAGDGLTRTQLSVLGTVSRAKRIGLSDLAEVEGLNPTMLSRVVGKLEAAGLIARSADSGDRRAVLVAVTATGTRMHQSLRRQRSRLFGDQLADLSPAQRAALVAAIPALEALGAGLRAGEPAGGPR